MSSLLTNDGLKKGPKVKPQTERDRRALAKNPVWQTHLATLVGLWQFDARSHPRSKREHNNLYFGPVVRAEIYRRCAVLRPADCTAGTILSRGDASRERPVPCSIAPR